MSNLARHGDDDLGFEADSEFGSAYDEYEYDEYSCSEYGYEYGDGDDDQLAEAYPRALPLELEHALVGLMVDVQQVARCAFRGVGSRARAVTWGVLAGLLPKWHGDRPAALANHHLGYVYAVEAAAVRLAPSVMDRIDTDVERTLPRACVFSRPPLSISLARMLRVYAHARADGQYVQGISDLAGLMLVQYLASVSRATSGPHADALAAAQPVLWWASIGELAASVPLEFLMAVEAEAFACLDSLLAASGLRGLYTPTQPRVLELLDAVDVLLENELPALAAALAARGISSPLYAHRWIACLFARELPVGVLGPIWDALFAYRALEANRLGAFVVALCIELLRMYGKPLLAPDLTFEAAIHHLQHLPLDSWGPADAVRFTARAAAAEAIRHRAHLLVEAEAEADASPDP